MSNPNHSTSEEHYNVHSLNLDHHMDFPPDLLCMSGLFKTLAGKRLITPLPKSIQDTYIQYGVS